jgi:signal recognition particle subunit SRP19
MRKTLRYGSRLVLRLPKITYRMLVYLTSMPEKRDTIVIWPIYFDSTKTRSEGRMVSAEDSVQNPSVDDVITATLKAGIKPEIEREKKHPSTWQVSSGRILVPKSEPKTAILKKIARSLKSKGKS